MLFGERIKYDNQKEIENIAGIMAEKTLAHAVKHDGKNMYDTK